MFVNDIYITFYKSRIINIEYKGIEFPNYTTYLTTGYNETEYIKFLSDIDMDYDSGYGSQQLFGTIWYKDGNWSTRGEYDGSEWWKYNSCPELPKLLDRLDKVRDEKITDIIG